MPIPGTTTKIDRVLNSKGQLVDTYTVEALDASAITDLEPPSGAQNIKLSLAEGRIVLTYDAPVEDSEEYSISGTTSQEPLATHPKFATGGEFPVSNAEWKVWDKWQKDGTDLAGVNLSGYGEGFQKFVSLFLNGFTDYLQPRLEMRVTTEEETSPDLSGIGKIAVTGLLPESTPPLDGDGNWMLTSIDARSEQPGKWIVTRQFTSSASAGWNEDIYG